MNTGQRLLPALALGAVLVLGTAASLAACGGDDDDNPTLPVNGGATTEKMMTETTEQMMTATTEHMMTETTEQMMTETTGG
jgi:hypothetical protein